MLCGGEQIQDQKEADWLLLSYGPFIVLVEEMTEQRPRRDTYQKLLNETYQKLINALDYSIDSASNKAFKYVPGLWPSTGPKKAAPFWAA
jgi:hypothetical protein